VTNHVLIAMCLTASLASACAVTAEEDPSSLGEIEASSCSKDPEGDLHVVSLTRNGRDVSYKSLTTRERSLLDTTITFTDRNTRGDGACEFYTNGWYCVTDFGECGCEHTDTGPDCYCQDGC
jgi:hypothetical protein